MTKLTLEKEPAVVVTAITGAISAVIGVLVAFNIDVSQDQQNAILGVVTAFATLIVLLGPILRSYVWSPNSVKEATEQAAETGTVPPALKNGDPSEAA
jgi:hypothetical protein